MPLFCGNELSQESGFFAIITPFLLVLRCCCVPAYHRFLPHSSTDAWTGRLSAWNWDCREKIIRNRVPTTSPGAPTTRRSSSPSPAEDPTMRRSPMTSPEAPKKEVSRQNRPQNLGKVKFCRRQGSSKFWAPIFGKTQPPRRNLGGREATKFCELHVQL